MVIEPLPSSNFWTCGLLNPYLSQSLWSIFLSNVSNPGTIICCSLRQNQTEKYITQNSYKSISLQRIIDEIFKGCFQGFDEVYLAFQARLAQGIFEFILIDDDWSFEMLSRFHISVWRYLISWIIIILSIRVDIIRLRIIGIAAGVGEEIKVTLVIELLLLW